MASAAPAVVSRAPRLSRAFFQATTVPSPTLRTCMAAVTSLRAPCQSMAMRRTATSSRKSTAAMIASRSHMRRWLSGTGSPARSKASIPSAMPMRSTRPPVLSAICSSSARLSRTVRNSLGYGTLTEACTVERRPSAPVPRLKFTRYAPASETGNSVRQRPGPVCTTLSCATSPPGPMVMPSGFRLVAKPPLPSVASRSTIAVSPSTRVRIDALVGTAGRSSQRSDCSQNARYSPHEVHAVVQRAPASEVNAIERPRP